MTYDFDSDFETLPTFGRVFDFRLCLRLSTFEKFFETAYDFRWHSLAGSGWIGKWFGLVGWFGLVFAGGDAEKPGTVENQSFPGCWWAVPIHFPVFAVLFSGLVYAVFRACNGAKIVFTGLNVS